jgi:hypothetical protein
MNFRIQRVIWCAALFAAMAYAGVGGPAQAQAGELAPDDPDRQALLRARDVAAEHVGRGDHAGALFTLLQSLRAAPGDRPELADTAYGNGQMISYVLLHLMPEPEAYAFAETGFAPDTYEIDKMVQTMCFIAIGLDSKDKTALTREALGLTPSKNKLVRAISLYFLSLPYFYDDRNFTQQHAELLAKEYPDSDLAQTALNLPLYAAGKSGDFDAVEKSLKPKRLQDPPYQPWSKNLRARVRECADKLATAKDATSRAEALQPLLNGITQAWDWRERYFSLLLLKGEFDGAIGPELREAARALAATDVNTPDAVEARSDLATTLSADCLAAPGDLALRDEAFGMAQLLLEKGVTELTPERVLWETWEGSLQRCAGNLAAAGHEAEARGIYQALIDRLPGSKVATACRDAMAALESGEETALQGPAE